MMSEKEKYIIPLALELNKHIECEIHYLKLPLLLKEKLTRLEELSRNKVGVGSRFIKEKHFLPLNSLKKLFISFLPGVTDMKAVGFHTEDSRWLISVEPINIELVIKILKVWIAAFYIEETELEKKRKNDSNTKKYAEQLINDIKKEMFEGCEKIENVVLFDNGKVIDKDAYSLFPLIAMNEIIGTNVIVADESSYWMYSSKNELVTNPLSYKDSREQDSFSYVASLSVQTLPPHNKPYLNVQISSRRWISKNETGETPFYKDEKSVYFRINDKKLQKIHAKYDTSVQEFEWIYKDEKAFEGIYGKNQVAKFNDIICNPSKYMNGVEQKDYYIVFEYGMKDGNEQMHNQDAGISPMDRKEIFDNIERKLMKYSEGHQIARKVAGNKTILKSYFTDDFKLEESLGESFRECINAICENKKIILEICYSSGQETLKNVLVEIATEHFDGTLVEIKEVNIGLLSETLICNEPKKRDNLEGYNARIREVKNVLGIAQELTMSIVIIHEPEYYKIGDKMDSRVDPKNALRVGFSNTGRLTQFIIIEKYLNKERKRLSKIENGKNLKKNGEVKKTDAVNLNVKNTLLDVYRQLGIHNCTTKKAKNSILGKMIMVGIHVVNFKNLPNDVAIEPFPIVIECDLSSHKIWVKAEFNIVSKLYGKKESVKRISCEYKEFPIKFREMITQIGYGKKLVTSERFLYDWFEELCEDNQYEIMMVVDGVSRNIVKGITNKSITECYDVESENVSKIEIDGKHGLEIDFSDYDNVNFIRIKVNDEVPDYISSSDDDKDMFEETAGVFKFDKVYYSKDTRTHAEYKNIMHSTTKLSDDRAFTHRNIIEIYPMYISERSKEMDCVEEIHNLRAASIQYEAGKTVLPMPLHLAKKLEEYII